MTTGKTIALTRRTFVGKVISLLFNMLSRLVIAFLPRSKLLLISWLQSPSSVILGSRKRKSVTVSIVSPSICHKVRDQMSRFSFFECSVLSQLFYFPLSLALKWSEAQWLSRVRLFATPWTIAYQAPLSMGFSRQENWSGLPFPSPGELLDPEIEPGFPTL